MKDELDGRIMTVFVGLRGKTHGYLKDNNDKDKKAKSAKMCIIKRKVKFQDYKNCLEVAQIEWKINYLEKKKIDEDSLKEDQKSFVKNNKLILKIQQRLKNERHDVFKTALSSNDDKSMPSIDSIETYAYGTSKDPICKKEKITEY